MFKFKALFPFLLFVLAMALLAPFAYIWALNVLFPSLNIPYSFHTWLAMVLAHMFFHTSVSMRK